MRPTDRRCLDPLEAHRRDVLDFLGMDRSSTASLPELLVGPTTPAQVHAATQGTPAAPAELVEMVVVDGVRYRADDAPDAPPRVSAPPDDDPLHSGGG